MDGNLRLTAPVGRRAAVPLRRAAAPLAALAAVVLLLVCVQPVRVRADSMQPTLRSGDQLVVERASLWLRAPRRGELVTARAPTGELVVKRIAAVGGQTLAIEDGLLVVDGVRVDEPWLDQPSVDGDYYGPVDVPAGPVFLLGDNRANSQDSRTYGAVAVGDVRGRVVGRLWPPGRP